MRLEDPGDLAGGWLFAHLEVLLSAWRSGRIEFEPELLLSHADADDRAPRTDLQPTDSPVNRDPPYSETPLPRTMGTYRLSGGRGLYT